MTKEIRPYLPAPDFNRRPTAAQRRYRILVSTETGEIESQASELIERGWMPVGSVTVQIRADGAFVYLQAMALFAGMMRPA